MRAANRALSAPATNAHWLPPPWQAIATRLRPIPDPLVGRVCGGRGRPCQPALTAIRSFLVGAADRGPRRGAARSQIAECGACSGKAFLDGVEVAADALRL